MKKKRKSNLRDINSFSDILIYRHKDKSFCSGVAQLNFLNKVSQKNPAELALPEPLNALTTNIHIPNDKHFGLMVHCACTNCNSYLYKINLNFYNSNKQIYEKADGVMICREIMCEKCSTWQFFPSLELITYNFKEELRLRTSLYQQEDEDWQTTCWNIFLAIIICIALLIIFSLFFD